MDLVHLVVFGFPESFDQGKFEEHLIILSALQTIGARVVVFVSNRENFAAAQEQGLVSVAIYENAVDCAEWCIAHHMSAVLAEKTITKWRGHYTVMLYSAPGTITEQFEAFVSTNWVTTLFVPRDYDSIVEAFRGQERCDQLGIPVELLKGAWE